MADAKQEMNNGTPQSRSVLAKPRLGAFGSSGFGSSPFGSILRPSQLKPGSNPFLKVTDIEEAARPESEPEKAPAEERLQEAKEDAPKFVPLGTTGAAPRSSSQVPAPAQPATGTSSFVFGQNLSERVVIQENVNNGDAGPSDHRMSNGTSGLLFTNAAASVKESGQVQEDGSNSDSNSGGEGLAAAAAKYERTHARPPPPPAAAATTTGEEGEINVLQISCRLFAWETGSWRERGRGVLRLNDTAGAGGVGAARLVVRVAGSLRVVLNTKLWPDMVAERAGTKSLRITAADAQQQVKLFLIMGAPGDIVQLHRALSSRIAMSKRSAGKMADAESARARGAAAEGGYGPECGVCPDSDETGETTDCTRAHSDPGDRLEPDSTQTSDEPESRVDSDTEQSETSKNLKRKEPADDETSPKRQCPDVLIE